jgi:hypothetical protein
MMTQSDAANTATRLVPGQTMAPLIPLLITASSVAVASL